MAADGPDRLRADVRNLRESSIVHRAAHFHHDRARFALAGLSKVAVVGIAVLGFAAATLVERRAGPVASATRSIVGEAAASQLAAVRSAPSLRVMLVLGAGDCEAWLTPLTRLARHISLSGDSVDAVVFLGPWPASTDVADLVRYTRRGHASVASPAFSRRLSRSYSRTSPLVVGVGADDEMVLIAAVPEVSRLQDHLVQTIVHLAAVMDPSAQMSAGHTSSDIAR